MSLNHSPFRNPLGDDGWTEIADATIPRMDLVGKAANGSSGFLLIKSGFDASDVRQLVAKTTPPKKESSVYTYVRGGVRVTSSKRLTNVQLSDEVKKAKAKLVAVYNSSGQLVGTVDPAKINQLGIAAAPEDEPAPAAAPPAAPVDETAKWKAKNAALVRARAAAPVTPEDATDGPAALAKAVEAFAPMVRNLNKTLAGARFAGDSGGFAGGSVEQRFAKLTQAVDPRTAGSLTDEVLRGAMSGMFGAGFSNHQAVHFAKRIALDAATHAADHVREAPEAVIKRVHQSNPTIY